MRSLPPVTDMSDLYWLYRNGVLVRCNLKIWTHYRKRWIDIEWWNGEGE